MFENPFYLDCWNVVWRPLVYPNREDLNPCCDFRSYKNKCSLRVPQDSSVMTWPLVNYTPRLPSIMCRPATQSPLKDTRRKNSSFIASPYNNKCCIQTFAASSTPTALSTYTKNGDRLRPHYRPVCLLFDSPAAHTVLFLHYLFIWR